MLEFRWIGLFWWSRDTAVNTRCFPGRSFPSISGMAFGIGGTHVLHRQEIRSSHNLLQPTQE